MSNTLRRYKSSQLNWDAKEMSVTAFVGQNWTPAIQFTIGMQYCTLAPNQIKDLITVLQKRLKVESGYSAVHTLPEKIIEPKIYKIKKGRKA